MQSFVRETFVLPAADTRSGVRVDLIFSTTPYEAQAIERSLRVEVGGRPVPFATAEDLILHKLFAGRPRDLEDAHGVVLRKRDELDWVYLERWAEEFSAVPGKEGIRSVLSELATDEARRAGDRAPHGIPTGHVSVLPPERGKPQA